MVPASVGNLFFWPGLQMPDSSPFTMGVARGLLSLLCLVGSVDAFVSPFVGGFQSARNTG